MDRNVHLAEINVARLIAPLDDPRLADFVAQLDLVNEVAERSPGFVWRLKADGGGASSYIRAFDDPQLLINISVWESLAALRAYVYRSHAHASVFRDRRRWFEPLDAAPLALWWIPAGRVPTIAGAIERLEHLRRHGPTAVAFTFKEPYPPPHAPSDPIAATALDVS
jgi:hypothetical protein